MSAPIGKQLQDARLARGLSLEDVQHHTRIPRPLLTAMESGDLGAFPNQTYARKFFALYGLHLGVEVTEFTRHFQPAGLAGVIRYNAYLQAPADRVGPAKRTPHSRHPHAPAGALYIGLAALALAAGVAIWAGLKDREAVGSPLKSPSAQPPPTAPAGPHAATTASPVPAVSPLGPSTRVETITPPQLPVRRATPVTENEPPEAKPAPDQPDLAAPPPAESPSDAEPTADRR